MSKKTNAEPTEDHIKGMSHLVEDRSVRAASAEVLLVFSDAHITKVLSVIESDNPFKLLEFSGFESLLRRGLPKVPSCLVVVPAADDNGSMIDSLKRMKSMNWRIPVLVIVSSWTLRSVGEMYRAGADEVMEKPVDRENLETSIRRALKNANLNHSLVKAAYEARERVGKLKTTEAKIVGLVISGFQNKEIASKLNLALVTVKVYRANAMKKLRAGNPAQLVKVAVLGGMDIGRMTDGKSKIPPD